MKRILQWLIALLQILFGLVFVAIVMFFILGKFDIETLKDGGFSQYMLYAFTGLFAALSAAVMVIALKQYLRVDAVVIADGEGTEARISAGKIRKVLVKAAAVVTGVKLKAFIINANTNGYVLTAKINVFYRNAVEAAAEFKGVADKLYEDIYGRIFKEIVVVIGKVKEKVDVGEVKQEVLTQLELSAANGEGESEPQYNAPPVEDAAEVPYFAPEPEPEPVAAAAVEKAAAEPVKETVEPVKEEIPLAFVPVQKKKAEPMIKIETAAKTAKAKVGAPAAKPKKQTIDPNDPPPFKL